MAKLVGGIWNLTESEKFDEYMKAVGVGMVMRKMGGATKPSQHFTIDGDTWTLKTCSTFKNTEISFKIGEEFDETTADGRQVKTTMTIEGDNKLIQTQKADVDSTMTREVVEDDKMVMTLVAKDVTCKRTYKRSQ